MKTEMEYLALNKLIDNSGSGQSTLVSLLRSRSLNEQFVDYCVDSLIQELKGMLLLNGFLLININTVNNLQFVIYI